MKYRAKKSVVWIAAAALLGVIAASPAPPVLRPPNRYTTVPVFSTGAREGAEEGLFPVGRNRAIIRKNGAQSETSIAVDPTDPQHLMAASNDLSNFATFNNVWESFDNGRTWASAGFNENVFCYDPWLDFNADGDAFFTYECSGGVIQRVAFKLAGQATWTKIQLNNAGSFPDRDMIVLDRNPGSPFLGSAYIGYDDAGIGNVPFLLYSRTGMSNYLRTPDLNDTTQATIGVNAATCPDGSVHAHWLEFDAERLVHDHSTNGGAAWSTDDVVHNFRLNTAAFFIFIPPQPDRGIVPMPFSDCAQEGAAFEGRLYVTYTDRGVGQTGTDVYIRWSDDNGQTWSAEVEVDDELVDAYQFHSNLSVGPDGTVFLSYYDTRADFPNNEKIHRYIAFSLDGGATWTNEQMTTVQSDFSTFGDPNDTGDYQSTDARPNRGAWSIWADNRPGTLAEDGVGAQARP